MAGSAAVNQLKQANKEASVEAKEEKTALVDTTEHVEEAEDKTSQQQYKGLNQMKQPSWAKKREIIFF